MTEKIPDSEGTMMSPLSNLGILERERAIMDIQTAIVDDITSSSHGKEADQVIENVSGRLGAQPADVAFALARLVGTQVELSEQDRATITGSEASH